MSASGKPKGIGLGRFIRKSKVTDSADVPVGGVPEHSSTARTNDVPSKSEHVLIASVALEVWRLHRRVNRLAERMDEESVRPLRESLRRLDDLFVEHGLELREHEGEVHTDGHQFEVVHIRDGGDPLMVVETVQPTVVLQGKVVRHGQVVLGARDAEV